MKTSAIEERRQRRRRRRRAFILWTSAASIVVLVAAIGVVGTMVVSALAATEEPAAERVQAEEPAVELIEFPQDEPAATAGAQPCVGVPVLSSFENAGMAEALAAAYNAAPRNVAGSCVTVTTSKDKSGMAATHIADDFPLLEADAKPTVWLPDASTWLDVAAAKGATSQRAEGTSAGTSNIVLAMPAPLAEAIGWDAEPPTWAEVFTAAGNAHLWHELGHSEWGAFKLGKTSPLVATSGEAAMFASFGSSASGVDALTAAQVADAGVVEEVRMHELATSHYMATPEHFLWHARQAEETGGSSADFLSAVIVDEKSVWDYNRGITSRDGVTRVEGDPPREQLVPIYPTDGYYAADNPAMRLAGDWINPAEAEAAADFVRFIRTAQGQAAVRASGYRDLNGRLDAEVASVAHLADQAAPAIALPGADVVTAVHDAFPQVRKRANVLFLVDVSGSMDEPISASRTKLDGAKDAILRALDHFTAGDSVGLAAFAQAVDGSLVPGQLTPVADIGTSRAALERAIGGLKSMGDTPLYQAVDEFTARQASSWAPDRINAVVVLSDGEDDPLNAPTIGEKAMLANLGELHHTTPVLVFTLAYGADADIEALQAISKATGAHYYDATDPTKVEAVLGDLVTSF
jgi:Ca-activated chloride channel family protein